MLQAFVKLHGTPGSGAAFLGRFGCRVTEPATSVKKNLLSVGTWPLLRARRASSTLRRASFSVTSVASVEEVGSLGRGYMFW